MRKLTFSLLAVLVFALLAGCSRDPVAPDLAEAESLQPAADETPRGLLALINRLEQEGGLNHRQAEWLREQLKKAVQFERDGRPERAERVYEHMIQQVGGWRDNGEVTTDVAEGLISYIHFLGNKYVSISAGTYHSCGLRPSGRAYCWGDNSSGELGDGTNSSSNTPVKVAGGHVFASIDTGYGHTCGVTASTGPRDPGGVGYCWGRNLGGALGDGSNAYSNIPVKVAGGHSFASIIAGYIRTCGLTTAGKAYCWGSNEYGALGTGDYGLPYANVPVAVAGGHTFASVSTAGDHTCGVTTAGIGYCWGGNDEGQLGDGTNNGSSIPVAVLAPRGTTFASIDVGDHTCGVTTAGTTYCWGNNSDGQLGDGTNVSSNVPVAVITRQTFSSITASDRWTCGLTMGGDGRCWGFNEDGRLGNGSFSTSYLPASVAGGHTWASISAGYTHGCGVTTDQIAYCWGTNAEGKLGDGTNTDSAVPVAVASPYAHVTPSTERGRRNHWAAAFVMRRPVWQAAARGTALCPSAAAIASARPTSPIAPTSSACRSSRSILPLSQPVSHPTSPTLILL